MRLYLKQLLVLFGILLSSYQMFAKASTPEQYGAKGDGVTDDTKAVMTALLENEKVFFNGRYRVKYITIPEGRQLIGKGSASFLYFAIDVSANCTIKNIVFDGEWNTRGLQILGSNVQIKGCSFIHTKGTLEYYGGLTSAIWVGRYQDLEEKIIKYKKVTISDCSFSGCEPYDSISNISNNRTVARYILSYGCNDFRITRCTFKELNGLYDSDAIQLCSYAIKSDEFPFYCYNDNWTSKKHPYLRLYYAPCKTIVDKCIFEQATCKSSIKIMSSGVRIFNNQFVLLNNDDLNPCYSVVRTHFVKDVIIKDNSFLFNGAASTSTIKIGNSRDVVIERNSFTSNNDEEKPPIVFDMSYTQGCEVKKNAIKFESIGNLFTTEYNDNLCIKRNIFEIYHIEDDMFKLITNLSNHYSYPPIDYTEGKFENNRFVVKEWDGGLFDVSNKYDFPMSFVSNKIKKNGTSADIKLYNNGRKQ